MVMIDIPYKTILPQTALPIIIIGAGGIVKDAHLPAYRKAGFHVHGIVNRTKAKAEALAVEFGIPHVYDTVEDAVAQAPENAVYDVTIMPNKFIETLEALPVSADPNETILTSLRRAGAGAAPGPVAPGLLYSAALPGPYIACGPGTGAGAAARSLTWRRSWSFSA